VRENEELTRRLKKFVERLDNDKSDLFQQLLEEKRLIFSDLCNVIMMNLVWRLVSRPEIDNFFATPFLTFKSGVLLAL